MKKLLLVSLVAGLASVAAQAADLTATATFQVKMTIVKSCSVSAGSSSDINLGDSVLSTATNQTGDNTISVTCSKTTPYTIGLRPTNDGTDNGTGSMISVANGATNSDRVPYTLYTSSAMSTVWGNTSGTNTVASPVGGGTGAAQSYTVHARNTNANFTPDSYADTVTVTVTY